MKRETLAEVKTQRDYYREQGAVAEDIMRCLARGDAPDAEDRCSMPDGTEYRMRVFGVDRAHGGTILISFLTPFSCGRETFDAQYFEAALIQARATRSSAPDAWAYRDAFDRLESKIRERRKRSA